MSYNGNLPMDDEYIAAGPADIRENFRALKDDQIVDAGKLAGLPAGNASGNIPKSNGVVNANLNADLLDGQEASAFATASHNHSSATTSTAGFMSAADKSKMDGIDTGAQVNQNSFSNVVVGNTTIQADSATDTLTLAAGQNISITPDATNDAVTIAVTGTVASAASAGTCTGNSVTASRLATARAISLTGDATGSVTFDGSAAVSGGLTLAASGVTPGTYKSITVDAKGRVTAGTNPTTLAGYGITDAVSSTGNAASATRATQDAAGNVITSTYAPLVSPTFTGTVSAPTITVTTALNIPGGRIWIS